MSLDLQTVTNGPLPAGDLYHYGYYPVNGKYTLLKLTSAGALSYQTLVPFPPTSFNAAGFVDITGASLPAATYTKIVADPYLTGPVGMTTVSEWGAITNDNRQALYYNSAWSLRNEVFFYKAGGLRSLFFGGKDASGPLSTMLSITAPNTFNYLDVISFNEFPVENGATVVYSYTSNNLAGGSNKIWMLLNKTTGRIAEYGSSMNYFTLLVPAGGQILQLFYRDRLYYLVQKVDTTIWLYDANNNGRELQQVAYSTYDPATAIKLITLY